MSLLSPRPVSIDPALVQLIKDMEEFRVFMVRYGGFLKMSKGLWEESTGRKHEDAPLPETMEEVREEFNRRTGAAYSTEVRSMPTEQEPTWRPKPNLKKK